MSKAKYSSLQDAFGISSFNTKVEKDEPYKMSYKVEIPNKEEVIALPYTEKFEDKDEVYSCEMVAKHCKNCSCQKSYHKNVFAEFLNFVLICIVLWILIYRPRP